MKCTPTRAKPVAHNAKVLRRAGNKNLRPVHKINELKKREPCKPHVRPALRKLIVVRWQLRLPFYKFLSLKLFCQAQLILSSLEIVN